MKNNKMVLNVVIISAFLTLAGCTGMTARQQNTAVGAGVGGVAGNLLTGGSALGTVGGAVVGGVIGNHVDTPATRQEDYNQQRYNEQQQYNQQRYNQQQYEQQQQQRHNQKRYNQQQRNGYYN